MALLTDDCNLNTTYLRTFVGGNGDYYIEVIDVENGIKKPRCVRITTSGGFCKDVDVKIAVANLYRAMEKAGLNEYPDDPMPAKLKHLTIEECKDSVAVQDKFTCWKAFLKYAIAKENYSLIDNMTNGALILYGNQHKQ